MQAWLIWLIAGVALVVAELFSLELVLIMFATGAFAAAIAAGNDVSIVVQSLIFAGVSIFTLVLVRPLIQGRLNRSTEHTRTNIDALRDASAQVLRRVDEFGGLVQIGGEEWTAQAIEPSEVFEPGQKVVVVEIRGATALVRRHQQ